MRSWPAGSWILTTMAIGERWRMRCGPRSGGPVIQRRVTPSIQQTVYRRRMNALARLILPGREMSAKLEPTVVSRTREHAELEMLLGSLRRRRKELRDRLDAMHGQLVTSERVEVEYAEVNAEIVRIRKVIAPHRAAHLQAMRKAFRPAQRDAAKRALAAIREAEAAVGEINALHAELRRLGAANPDIATKPLLYVVLPLERLAREKGEAQ